MERTGIFKPIAIGLVFVFLLTGCAPDEPKYAIFDSTADSEDAVPDALPSYAGDSADLTTSRFVGEHDGVPLWLLRGREGSTVCLLAFPDAVDWVMGCGGESGPGGMEGPSGEYVFQPDGLPAPEDASRISTNVYAVEPTG